MLGLGLGACRPRAPIVSCDQDLSGLYVVEGSPGTWAILDPPHGPLELYPLFDDSHDPIAPASLQVAPRVIDIAPGPLPLHGTVHRRYQRGRTACDGTAPVALVACHADTLELVIGAPVPPIAFDPCTFGPREPARRELWHRQP